MAEDICLTRKTYVLLVVIFKVWASGLFRLLQNRLKCCSYCSVRFAKLLRHKNYFASFPWLNILILKFHFFPATFCVRMVTFPLVIIAQRNVGAMNNHMPQIQALQEKLTDARRRGDVYESQILGSEMQNYMKKHGVNPLKNMVPILAQVIRSEICVLSILF